MTITDNPRPSPFLCLIEEEMTMHRGAIQATRAGDSGGLDYLLDGMMTPLRMKYPDIDFMREEVREIVEWAILEEEIHE